MRRIHQHKHLERGTRCGFLTVLFKARRYYWTCRCQCGNVKAIRKDHLSLGRTTSCGCLMHRPWAEIEKRQYGNLSIIRRDGSYGGCAEAVWLCQCSCGKQIRVRATELRNNIKMDCGCIKKNHPPCGKGVYVKYSHYKRGAERRSLSFTISKEDFDRMCKMSCYICGREPVKGFFRNGIDRLDSYRGYEAGNVAPCCARCNRAKGTMSLAEFIEWIKTVSVKLLGSDSVAA